MRPLFILCAVCLVSPLWGAEPDIEKGHFRFTPAGEQTNVPERYRLQERVFDYQCSPKRDLPNSGVRVFRVRFPSPVKTATPENNTVHAEYLSALRQGTVSRRDRPRHHRRQSEPVAPTCRFFSRRRRSPPCSCRWPTTVRAVRPAANCGCLMPNIQHTLAAVRQTVLDLRVATAWLESRPEIDEKRLGIMGTSLGSFMAALTAEMEPKLGRVAVLLGGGGFVDAYYDHPKAASYRKVYEALGGTKEMLARLIAPADPHHLRRQFEGPQTADSGRQARRHRAAEDGRGAVEGVGTAEDRLVRLRPLWGDRVPGLGDGSHRQAFPDGVSPVG